ncbi:hypothetical protein ACJMK2_024411, partial [Sinanodonta woodiana]
MTGNIVCIFFLVVGIECGSYGVQGSECCNAREPIIITGHTIYSVNFTWECALMLNESIVGMEWLKDDKCIATAFNGTSTPCEGYYGRVALFERYGISISNVSRKDSGNYTVVILLAGNLHQYVPCHPTYLP